MTIIVLWYYYSQEKNHMLEIEKINKLEYLHEKEERHIDDIRKHTDSCTIGMFNDPRSCYFESGYKCTWNENAKRCDLQK